MKKLIIGVILGFVLTLPFKANASDPVLYHMLTVLEQINDQAGDIVARLDSLIEISERPYKTEKKQKEYNKCVSKKFVEKCSSIDDLPDCIEESESECNYIKERK